MFRYILSLSIYTYKTCTVRLNQYLIPGSFFNRVGKNSGAWHQWSQKFFQVSRKNEREKGKGISTEKRENGKSFFCQNCKDLIDSHY